MSGQRLGVCSVLLGTLGFCGLWFLQVPFFHQALEQEKLRSAQRLLRATAPVAVAAIQGNDDILLQQLVQGLSHSTDVLMVCIADRNGKIVAHSLPGKLGQPFKKSGDWMTRTLGESTPPLGTLAVWMSSKHLRQMEHRQTQRLLFITLWGLFVGGGLLTLWARQRHLDDQRAQESIHQQMQTKDLLRRAEAQLRVSQDLYARHLASALEQIERPLVLLNASQRIAALNTSAQAWLHETGSRGDLRGRHVLDMALLGDAFPVLEASLQQPGQIFPGPSESTQDSLRFLTLRASPEEPPFTWVYLPGKLI